MKQTKDYLTNEFCEIESKKYTSRGSFAKGCPSAYNKARIEGWLDEYVWLKPQRHEKGYWTEARCESVARSYQHMYDFQTENLGAYNAAKRNGWLKKYTWLEKVSENTKPRGYWDSYENCYVEAQRHKTLKSFIMQSGGAYNSALEHGWMEDYTWLEGHRRKNRAYYTYDVCYELANCCKNKSQFIRDYPTAYKVSKENGWIEEYIWFKNKKCKQNKVQSGYWSVKDNCRAEALKYSKRRDFREKSNSAYKSSVKNGWIDDFTWLETYNHNTIWTKEICKNESRKYNKLKDFRKYSPKQYNASKEHGWLKDFVWLERSIKPSNYWNEKTCMEEAKKYNTLNEFFEFAGSAYNKACENGWLKDYYWLKRHEKNGQEHIISEEKKISLHNRFAKTTEQFIKEAKEVHGDKYEYSKTNYLKNSEKVCITCPKHGDFWQTPKSHLNGNGCKKCGFEFIGDMTRKSGDDFMKEVTKKWGDILDFSEVEYKNSTTPICVICHKKDKNGEEHGRFYPRPNNLLNGHGCPKCGKEHSSKVRSKSIDIAKNEIIKIHGDKYEFVDFYNYENNESKITLKCPIHGNFDTTTHRLLNGQGCPICGNIKAGEKIRLTQEEFISRSNEIHGDKYDYSKTIYVKSNEKVTIICQKHGEFEQYPIAHMTGKGCPLCNESKTERKVAKALDENNIKYERQKRFPWLKKQSLDFYLPEYNIAIECQSSLHYTENFFRLSKGEEYAKKQLEIVKERDERKKRLCDENGVHLIYFMEYKYLKYANPEYYNFSTFNEIISYIKERK